MTDRRVLVVDDCRMTTLLLRHILASEGIASDAASTGPEADEKIRAGNYAVAIVDIVLPGFSGVELAARIRDDLGERTPAIFLVTGMGENFEPSMVDRAGARGVFFKPITPSKVVRAVAQALATSVITEDV